MRRALSSTSACENVGDVSNVQQQVCSEGALDQGDVTLTVRGLRIGQCGGGVMTTPARYPQITPGRNPASMSAIHPDGHHVNAYESRGAQAPSRPEAAHQCRRGRCGSTEALTAPSTAQSCRT